ALRHAEFLYLVQRDPQAAVKAYERAVELAPRRWQTRQQLAWVLYEIGRLEEAEAVIREILEWSEESAPRELLDRIVAKRQEVEDSPTERIRKDPEGRAGTSPRISAALDLIQLAQASG